MDVGFIGLGKMGAAMARNIAKAGHRVRAWNRSPDAAKGLDGVGIASSLDEAFQADAVFTMLSDDAAIRAVILDSHVLQNARAGAVHVVTSTISVGFVDELCARHDEAGVRYVAAPVFGRPDVAEAGQLNIMAAGSAAALDIVRPLLEIIGRKTWILGADPKQANAAKIAGNMMIAMAIEAMAEAVALTGRHGLEPEPFLALMTETLFGCRAYQNYSGKIVTGDYEPGFRMQLGLKDLGLAIAAKGSAARSLPLLEAVHARMAAAVAAGLGDKDWAALADYTIRTAG